MPQIPLLDDVWSSSTSKIGCLTATCHRVPCQPGLGGREPSSILRGGIRRPTVVELPMERVFDGSWRVGCWRHRSVASHRAPRSMVLDGAQSSSMAHRCAGRYSVVKYTLQPYLTGPGRREHLRRCYTTDSRRIQSSASASFRFVACCMPSHFEILLLHAYYLSQDVAPILGTAPRQ